MKGSQMLLERAGNHRALSDAPPVSARGRAHSSVPEPAAAEPGWTAASADAAGSAIGAGVFRFWRTGLRVGSFVSALTVIGGYMAGADVIPPALALAGLWLTEAMCELADEGHTPSTSSGDSLDSTVMI